MSKFKLVFKITILFLLCFILSGISFVLLVCILAGEKEKFLTFAIFFAITVFSYYLLNRTVKGKKHKHSLDTVIQKVAEFVKSKVSSIKNLQPHRSDEEQKYNFDKNCEQSYSGSSEDLENSKGKEKYIKKPEQTDYYKRVYIPSSVPDYMNTNPPSSVPDYRHIKPYCGAGNVIPTNSDYYSEIDKLKKSDCKIAFFDEYGILDDVFPRSNDSLYEDRGIAYQAEYIVIDEVIYDLKNVEDIKNINSPCRSKRGVSVTFDIAYILRMHIGRTDDVEVETALADKTVEFMFKSKRLYTEPDYLNILTRLMKLGEFEKADSLYNDIIAHLEKRGVPKYSPRYNNEDYAYLKVIMQKRFQLLQEYKLVCEVLPDYAPKSFSGYSRMKNGNTKNYQKIVADMESNGYSDFGDK